MKECLQELKLLPHIRKLSTDIEDQLDEVVESVFRVWQASMAKIKVLTFLKISTILREPLFRHFLAALCTTILILDLRKLEAQKNEPDMEDLIKPNPSHKIESKYK